LKEVVDLIVQQFDSSNWCDCTEANRPVVFSKEQINFFSISRTITESQSHPFHTVMDLSTFSPELVAEIRARIQNELRAKRNQIERDIEALDEAQRGSRQEAAERIARLGGQAYASQRKDARVTPQRPSIAAGLTQFLSRSVTPQAICHVIGGYVGP
jgi:hypothetical protein